MTFPEKLTAALKELETEDQLKDLKVEVIPSGGYRFVVIVTSPSFEDIPDYIRQEMVWGKVLERLDNYEQRSVEFIDTPSPSDEQAEVDDEPPPKKRKKPAKRR
ncbi:MAG TPA: hypothetical protein VFF52_07980 [Isosphaeraceae bacterium]|nr:hypothetical protein [Isosphaeraceae bacterium]